MSKFDALMADIAAQAADTATLAKALPAEGEGDEKIVAAAAEGGDGKAAVTAEEEEEGKGKEPIMKAMQVTLADGTTAEAVDATEMVKSLQEKVGALTGQLTDTEETLLKALGDTLGLVKSQGALLKAQGERLDKLASTGAGRKAVVTVHEKPAVGAETVLAKSEETVDVLGEFLAKSQAAYDGGAITGQDLLRMIDVSVRERKPVDAALLKRVSDYKPA